MPKSVATRRRPIAVAVGVILAVVCLAGCLQPGQDATLRSINADRTAHALRALPIHGAAQAKAQRWAEHLAAKGVLEHSNLPDGFSGVQWCSIGENVGYGPDVQTIEKAYMASPGHRANILSTKWNYAGVGYAKKGNRVYTVHVFLRTC